MAGTYKSIFKPKHPKKYIGAAIASVGSGIVYLIMHYGGAYKWWILGLYVVIAFLACYFFISRNNNSI